MLLLANAVVFASTFTLQSSVLSNNAPIDTIYTCDGKNISPPLAWMNPPAHTQSYVLILYNPDAPYGIFYNWVLYNIPENVRSLAEAANLNLPLGSSMGNTSSGDVIYRGPCPANAATHHYIFKLYALDALLDFDPQLCAEDVLAQIKSHILGEAELTVTFSH